MEEAIQFLSTSITEFISSQHDNTTMTKDHSPSSSEPSLPSIPYLLQRKLGPLLSSEPDNSKSYRMPNLLTFNPPPLLQSFYYDDSQTFFTGELDHGDGLLKHLHSPLNQVPSADLSSRNCWKLQQSFIGNFLRWVPIFDDETCLRHIQQARDCGYSEKSSDVCLTLLMYAIGAISSNERFYHGDTCSLPGYPYILLASKLLDQFRFSTRDITHLQCGVLLS